MRARALLAAAVLACSHAPPAGRGAPAPALDPDGVAALFPSAPGSSLRLGGRDPAHTAGFAVEGHMGATAGAEGALHFWNLPSYPLDYASGGTGWTTRLHLLASGGQQRFTWRDQPGYLSSPADVRSFELTVFVRVHGILDPARAQVTLKVRGGAHTAKDPDRASCTMMTLSPRGHGTVARFGKELHHPEYDYVPLAPAFDAALEDGRWVGLKLVSWLDEPRRGVSGAPRDARRVRYRLYLDPAPFDPASGRPRNGWRLFSAYDDVDGVSTGKYDRAATWGGWLTTLRTDGFHDVDVALPSVREIVPPAE